MCATNTCGKYGSNWACPPGCGELDECRAKVAPYKWGIIVQTSGQLEDSFDIETMMEAAESHKKRFSQAVDLMRGYDPDCLPMGAGGCNLCRKCTYPDEPCRFPDKAFTSMEAYGLFVAAECKKAGLEYNYGPNTLTYSSCILFND